MRGPEPEEIGKSSQDPEMESVYPLFPHLPFVINSDVPQFEAFEQERLSLLRFLEDLSIRYDAPPIWLIEHKGCFTNRAMKRTLSKILGNAKMFQKYVKTYTIDPEVYQYPPPKPGRIFILGGSVNDTYDPFGRDFTRRFSLPLLEQVQQTHRSRVLGICFGHQSLVEAYGMMLDVPIKTIKQDTQFGFYPVNFAGAHPALHALNSLLPRAVAFTRSGYPRRMDGLSASDIPGLHVYAEFAGFLRYTTRDSCFIPPGISYLGHPDTAVDMVLSLQGHPEIESTKTHLGPVFDYISSVREFITHIVQPYSPFEVPRKNKIRTISSAFFIPLLRNFAHDLAQEV